MDQNNQPIQQINPAQWQSGTNTTLASMPPTRNPRKKHLVVVVFILLLALAGAAVFFVVSRSATTCLNANDYQSLTGVNVTSDLSPVDMFYTDYISFKSGSADYDNTDDDGSHGLALLRQVASFYKSLPNKPIIITVSGTYITEDQVSVASKRINAVRSTLIAAGVPGDAVVVKDAGKVVLDNDTSTYNEGETTISITSDPSCRQ